MKVFRTQKELKSYLKNYSDKLKGFVPTMGALHEGHISLIKQAKNETDLVICSIFVNPTQFNDPKDFEKYPATHENDIQLLTNVGCDVLYLPETVADVYLHEQPIQVNLGQLGEVMEGANRPGHFNGVMQVVKVLFDIVMPNKAYFGLKDFQQYSIIKKMVAELDLPIEIIGCPIVREQNGLAMSSRNMLLSKAEQEDALIISEVLLLLQRKCKVGSVTALLKECVDLLATKSTVEYLVIAAVDTLEVVEILEANKEYRAFVVSRVGNVRLIDNIQIFI